MTNSPKYNRSGAVSSYIQQESEEYQKKLDSVKDWTEAVRWVGHAVKRESERLIDAGEHSPEAFLNAETLRAAWDRILRG